VFKICYKNRKIPATWKKSKTILIPKDGDPTDIKNWRPIALCKTIYKLYTSCLVDRLRSWAVDEEVICSAQKGFMPYDGVIEHNFTLQTYLDNARTNQGSTYIAMLDLSNAFGSMPTDLILAVLRKAGVGEELEEIIGDIVTGGSTTIATKDGTTGELMINSGVRQGCPLSGFLFNTGIEPLVRSLIRKGAEDEPNIGHHCLAYADDLTLIAEDPNHLQELISDAAERCLAMGLQLNARKCFSLHMSGTQPRGTRDTQLYVGGTEYNTCKSLNKHKSLDDLWVSTQ
jgi:hypothetical protein